MASDMSWDRQYARSNTAVALSDLTLDLDALMGGCLDGDADPHYPDLPCYVALIDEDEALGPFAAYAEDS